MQGATASTTGTDQNWWYQQDDETKGPISGAELQGLVNDRTLPSGTLVWNEAFGESWKPFDQTDLTVRRPPSVRAEAEGSSYPPSWQKTFDKLDKDTSEFPYTWSFLGFLFGPLYYFYLRMWRKGLLIIGLSICANVLFMLGHALLGLPEFNRWSAVVVEGFCSVFVTRDYYRFKKLDERVWPPLARFANSYVIAALIVVPVVVILVLSMIADSYADDAPTKAAQAADVVPAMSGKVSSVTLPSEAPPRAEFGDRRVAETACQEWLQTSLGGQDTNPYDPSATYTYKVIIRGGDVRSTSGFFGGHPTMYFNAQAAKYINGRFDTSIDIPLHVCVLDDNMQVLGIEAQMSDGLK